MRITVVGAAGRTGEQVVAQALAAGHAVTAVARTPPVRTDRPSGPGPEPRWVAAGLGAADAAALESAFAGADAVLSCVGPRRISDAGFVAPGAEVVVRAMRAAGARRLVVVSASPVATVASPQLPDPPRRGPGDGPLTAYLMYPVLRTVMRGVYPDLARMEDVVRGSGLDWTIVRPPRLTAGARTDRVRVSVEGSIPRGYSVSRADLAAAMLDAVDDAGTVGKYLWVAS